MIYRQEEVTFTNTAADIILAGTLTIPDNQKPIATVLLIAGHGPHTRGTAQGPRKRFFLLADHLTKNGLAVLRYDKRGIGQSTGNYDIATSRDFADDALAAIEYLKTRTDLGENNICVVGHSEGGMIATMIAAESKDISLVVSMAGVVQLDTKGLVLQDELQMRADGASKELITRDNIIRTQFYTIVRQQPHADTAQQQLHEIFQQYWKQLPEELKVESNDVTSAFNENNIDSFIDLFNGAWFRYFLTCKPEKFLARIKIPLLALYGDKDWIVSSKIALPIIDRVLRAAGNNDYTLIELPDLNHSFQQCVTGSSEEYETLKESLAPEFLSALTEWIVRKSNKQCMKL
ncbi:MAG: hypothetical protein UU47_C0026G0007 [candidate division TM6 bacterium GW2011_GWE2_41_16]|nr:MAG: hypothetical protein UU47_C0026G0007 [candidate division TM6 bacterium GW2011_GWE2_41_16]